LLVFFSLAVVLNPPHGTPFRFSRDFGIPITTDPYLGVTSNSLNSTYNKPWQNSSGFFVDVYSGDVGKRASDSVLNFTGGFMRFFYAEVRIKTAFKH
jgi:hypothetical protein